MSMINTQGIAIYLQTADATPLDLVPTAISSTDPAVITVADATGLTEGDIVLFGTTGFDELNDKFFAVGSINTTNGTFTAIGADLTDTTGTLGASPTATIYTAADQVKLCLSAIDIAADSVNEIDVSTFCEVGTMAGKKTLGTLTLTGFCDPDDVAMGELQLADTDATMRFLEIVMPGTGNGYLIGRVTLSGLSYTVPIEGAVGFTMTGTQNKKLVWRY